MLDGVRHSIEELIALYEAEKAENTLLREELRQSREAGAALKEQIDELESEIDTRNLKDAFNGGNYNPEAKKKIESLIKGIDKCISLLEEA